MAVVMHVILNDPTNNILFYLTKRVELLNGCVEQQAVGSQGSEGTLNPYYSAGELLKAPVSNQG